MTENQNDKKTFLKSFFSSKKKTAVFVCIVSFFLLVTVLSLLLILVPSSEQSENDLPLIPPVTNEEGAKLKPVIPDDEMRGVYIASVSNINFPSQPGLGEEALKKELDSIVTTVVATGFDTVFFQVRPSADALYPSQVFPSSRYLVAKEGDPLPFDVLEYLIEKLKEYEVGVVAWVNPYRVTAFSANSKEEALALLSEENPAAIHPEWTVFYDGKLYYDPALQEVRDLICRGLAELCDYDIDGILYDDYFYPYPVAGKSFSDGASYSKYGNGQTLADWRRENVNRMVEDSYRTVKECDPQKTFGVSPFGIWQNASSDPSGSDTKGQEAYSAIYADAVAWIEGGYLDYISPQIYWERGNSAADFETLTRWWSAQVDGTKVKLIISHAAYKVGSFSLGAEEIVEQIRYARAYMGSVGNIQYGFSDIQKNTNGLQDALAALYEKPVVEKEASVSVTGVKFARPYSGYQTTRDSQFISCASDPRFPVYTERGKIGRTKSGFFSLYTPLSMGKNTITLTQNGVEYHLTLVRKNASGTTVARSISSVSPQQSGVLIRSGEKLRVSLDAPSHAAVKVQLGDQSFSLRPTLYPSYTASDRSEHYEGVITVPALENGGRLSLGYLVFTAEVDGVTLTKNGPDVTLISRAEPLSATVIKDYSYLKNSPDSSFYDDPIPASVGMVDRIVGYEDEYYRLACGYYIHQDSVTVAKEDPQDFSIQSLSFQHTERALVLKIGASERGPVDVTVSENFVEITLFGGKTSLSGEISLPSENCLFTEGAVSSHTASRCVKIRLSLRNAACYYGFRVSYEEDEILVSFRYPLSIASDQSPLAGMTVVIDAGHGGNDPGALGFLGDKNEKDLNLMITLRVKERLEALGAAVVLSRGTDQTVSLAERMDLLTQTDPDFAISIHHNSTDEGADANLVKGTLGLFWSPAGRSLSDYVTRGVSDSLGTPFLGSQKQMLALCRNHRFPQALVEVSFICSPTEYEMALREEYAEEVARGIEAGVLSWIKAGEEYRKEVL